MNHPAIPRGAGRRYCAPERFYPTNVRIDAVSRGTQRLTTWAVCGMFCGPPPCRAHGALRVETLSVIEHQGESGNLFANARTRSVSYVKISNG